MVLDVLEVFGALRSLWSVGSLESPEFLGCLWSLDFLILIESAGVNDFDFNLGDFFSKFEFSIELDCLKEFDGFNEFVSDNVTLAPLSGLILANL